MQQNSVWYHHTFNAHHRPVLTGAHKADVVIVGGGYVGLSAALHLAQAGLQVIICEKDRIGDGPSGLNGGQVLSGFEADLEDVIERVGLEDTQRIWQLIETVRQQVICRAQTADYQSGVIYAAMGPRQLDGLRSTYALLKSGFNYGSVDLLDKGQLKAHVISPQYVGGLFFSNAGHFNPYKYVHALAAEVEQAGAKIFEQSAVCEWNETGVRTASGQVHARHFILAAGAGQTWPTRDFVSFKTHMMVTAPLPPAQLAAAFPGTAAVDDGRIFLSYARALPNGRVLFGGADSLIEHSAKTNVQRLKKEMAWIYPALADAEITHYWNGPIDFSANLLPRVAQLGPNIYQANGFSGHGLTLTHLFGQAMAEAILGERQKFDVLTQLQGAQLPRNRWLALATLGLPLIPEYVSEKLGRY